MADEGSYKLPSGSWQKKSSSPLIQLFKHACIAVGYRTPMIVSIVLHTFLDSPHIQSLRVDYCTYSITLSMHPASFLSIMSFSSAKKDQDSIYLLFLSPETSAGRSHFAHRNGNICFLALFLHGPFQAPCVLKGLTAARCTGIHLYEGETGNRRTFYSRQVNIYLLNDKHQQGGHDLPQKPGLCINL